MFDPTGKQKITIQRSDGTTCEMDGYVTSMDVSKDAGGLAETTVQFVASGPVTFDGAFVPDPPKGQTITNVEVHGGAVEFGPKSPRPYRPWSYESCLIAAMAVVWLAVWGILKWMLPWILQCGWV